MAWWHRVGQRVKLTRPINSENTGAEGFIQSLSVDHNKWSDRCTCMVVYNRETLSRLPISGRVLHWASGTPVGTPISALEPILPEGNKVVSWSDCLWRPSDYKENKRDSEHAREAVEVGR